MNWLKIYRKLLYKRKDTIEELNQELALEINKAEVKCMTMPISQLESISMSRLKMISMNILISSAPKRREPN
jgi:hypothetical protein